MAMIVALTRRLLGMELAALALASTLASGCAETSASSGGARTGREERGEPGADGRHPARQAGRDPAPAAAARSVDAEVLPGRARREAHPRVQGLGHRRGHRRAGRKASDVRVTGGSLNNKEVSDCLIAKLKDSSTPTCRRRGRCSTSTGSNRRIRRVRPSLGSRNRRRPRPRPRLFGDEDDGWGSCLIRDDLGSSSGKPRNLAKSLRRVSDRAVALPGMPCCATARERFRELPRGGSV